MARLIRVYCASELRVGDEAVLSSEASHHVMTVLRVEPGDSLLVFNGDGYEYLARITAQQKKAVTLQIQEQHRVTRESPLKIILAQGISRGERMEYAIQKAVELGVTEIMPLWTERCGVKLSEDRVLRRMAHWQAIMVGACEQSGRLQLPLLHPPAALTEWLARPNLGLRLICSPHNASVLEAPAPSTVSLLIGPEGGLSEAEVSAAITAGCQPLRLGPRILRTETAAVAAMAVVQARWGDLG